MMKRLALVLLFSLLPFAASAQSVATGAPFAIFNPACPPSTSASAAGQCVQRDGNANAFANNILSNATLTVGNGTTTTLTAGSSRYQALSTAAQTYVLPDATTLSLGPWFAFNNNSPGALTINKNGGAAQFTVPAGGVTQCGPTNIGSAAGTWDCHSYLPSTVSWGTGTVGLFMNNALSTTAEVGAGAASCTSPVFIPQRGAATTGWSGDGTKACGVVGGVDVLDVLSGGVTLDTGVLTLPNGTAGSPSLNFGDATTGFYRNSANVVGVAISGVLQWQFNGSQFVANGTHGPLLTNTNPSATVATIRPDKSNANSGIGADTAGDVSIIADNGGSATEKIRVAGTAISLLGLTTGTNADFLCLSAAGVVLIQTSACTISSLRFKQNVKAFTGDALSYLDRLDVDTYRLKATTPANKDKNATAMQVGLIAENIAKVMPLCAIYEQDMKTPKSYRQECVIAMLVKGMQEQQREIASLRAMH